MTVRISDWIERVNVVSQANGDMRIWIRYTDQARYQDDCDRPWRRGECALGVFDRMNLADAMKDAINRMLEEERA
jgi:hypothetical protein